MFSIQPDIVKKHGRYAVESDRVDINLIKHGYYGVGSLAAPNVGLRIWEKSKCPYEFCKNFTLTEIQELNSGLNAKFNYNDPRLGDLLSGLICGNCARLYFEYTKVHKVSEILLSATTQLDAVDMISDIMSRLPTVNLKDKTQAKRKLTNAVDMYVSLNNRLLVKLWLERGQQQFEDTAIYLRSKFLAHFPYFDSGLIEMACRLGAMSLLAYLFGYQIDADGRLSRLAAPGIFRYNRNEILLFLGEKSLPVEHGSPDALNLLITISERSDLT